MKPPTEMTDEELVEHIRTSDYESFAIIVSRYEEKLIRYARYILNDQIKAEDAVQDSFIKAYVNLNSFDLRLKFSSWLYRITHNESVNLLNKNRKEVPLTVEMDFPGTENPEEDTRTEEMKDMVDKCVSTIQLIYAEPLLLYYIDERSYAEISDILRIPISTVGTRISRGKNLMKKVCEKFK